MNPSNLTLLSRKWHFMVIVILGFVFSTVPVKANVTSADGLQAIESDFESSDPIFVINGEILNQKRALEIVSQLKPKYVKDFSFIEGKEAIDRYGPKAKDGVFIIELTNKQKALSDLDEESNSLFHFASQLQDQRAYIHVDKKPVLKGGIKNLVTKLDYPKKCREANGQGKVVLEVVVNKDGQVENPKVVKGINSSCNKAAIETVEAHAKFEPGIKDGKIVNTLYSIPLTFKFLSKDNAIR